MPRAPTRAKHPGQSLPPPFCTRKCARLSVTVRAKHPGQSLTPQFCTPRRHFGPIRACLHRFDALTRKTPRAEPASTVLHAGYYEAPLGVCSLLHPTPPAPAPPACQASARQNPTTSPSPFSFAGRTTSCPSLNRLASDGAARRATKQRRGTRLRRGSRRRASTNKHAGASTPQTRATAHRSCRINLNRLTQTRRSEGGERLRRGEERAKPRE